MGKADLISILPTSPYTSPSLRCPVFPQTMNAAPSLGVPCQTPLLPGAPLRVGNGPSQRAERQGPQHRRHRPSPLFQFL